MTWSCLAEAARGVLCTADPRAKVAESQAIARAWQGGGLGAIGSAQPPERPSRPARPRLRPAKAMPKRRKGIGRANRVALLHALAHIELNAIDLAWDLIARFTKQGFPQAFYDDWVGVAADEARHFALLSARLGDFGAAYGELPAHDGLWEAACRTAHDPLARLAVVPLVLEERGLDVTPAMIARMRRAGDDRSAEILSVIYRDEIGHVAAGHRWFAELCARRGLAPQPTYRRLVRAHFPGALKAPFNSEARAAAGLTPSYYETLAR
jgi:uncharacterized ferritin-like protein (DUF455 family)